MKTFIENFYKSQVKAHIRRTKGGRIVQVPTFERKGEKKKETKEMPEDFINDFAQKVGSAIDMWGNEEDHQKIWKLEQSGHKFKTINWENKNNSEKIADSKSLKLKKLKDLGWKEFDRENNQGQIEVLMYKK